MVWCSCCRKLVGVRVLPVGGVASLVLYFTVVLSYVMVATSTYRTATKTSNDRCCFSAAKVRINSIMCMNNLTFRGTPRSTTPPANPMAESSARNFDMADFNKGLDVSGALTLGSACECF